MSTIPQLPLDCLIHIFSQLPASNSLEGDVSVITLAQCCYVNSTFRQATSVITLWEPHYRSRYHHCIETNEAERVKLFNENFKLMFAERRRLDNIALTVIDKIVDNRQGRTEHVREVFKMGFDVWDALKREAEDLDGPLLILTDGSAPKPNATRCFWLRAILEEITRGYGVRLWRRMLHNGVSYAEGYSSISCFFGKTHKEVNVLLDDITARGREFIQEGGFILSAEIEVQDVKPICIKICEFMRDEGFGPVDAESFHNIYNQFPHCYLTTNRKTIPISLVHVFVAIARAVGIKASPVDFPGRVLVHIADPREDVDDFYVDTFTNLDRPILSLRDDIPLLLRRQGISSNHTAGFVSPCGPVPMLLRAGRNIMTALHSPINTSASLSRSSIIFALGMHIQLADRPDLIRTFLSGCEPLDCATFVAEDMIPCQREDSRTRKILAVGIKEVLEREEAEAKVIHYRFDEEVSVQHFVGLLFRHRLYGYNACIFGWDPVCAASEEWIREMRVDTLPRKRHQPFYHSFCDDGSVRYVAEDNISPLLNPSEEVSSALEQHINNLPRYFTGIHLTQEGKTSRGRFFLSPEVLKAYPEDDAIGRAWVEQVQSL
ncbi:YccV-like-domain-containing protein [Marasmius fiardii PR-910]|nr:YccV-like-domain-containing protein [Marasmius fiardii PR-910]